MKKLGVLVQIVLLLTASSIILFPAVSGTPTYVAVLNVYWGADGPVEVSSGDVATINVVLRWESPFSARSLTASLNLPPGFKAVGGTNKAWAQYTGATSSGTIIRLDFSIFIGRDVTIGNHTADLEIEIYLSQYAIPKEIHKISLEVTGKPSLKVDSLEDSLYEGNQKMSLIIRNKGDAAAENLKLIRVYSSNARIDLEDNKLPSRLESNVSVTVPAKIYVPLNLKSITLAMELTYMGPKNVLYTLSESLLFSVRSAIQTTAISITLEPKELTAGHLTELCLKVVNERTVKLTEVRLDLSADTIMKIFGDTTFYISKLDPKETKQVYTKIYIPLTTTSSTTLLTVTATYFDENFRLVQSETQKLNMFLRAIVRMPALTVDVEPEELTIGKTTSVHLEIANNGSNSLKEIRLDLSSDAAIKIFGDTTFYIDKLNPTENRGVNTRIYVPSTTTVPVASLVVTSTYFDEELGTVQSDSQKLNMLLRGFIDISLTDMAVIPSTPPPGTFFSITVTITNIGTSTAYATYAIPLIGKLPLKTFGPKSVYIGNVEINQPTTFTVNLQMDSTKEKTITLPIALSYIDNLRSQYNITLTASITVGTTQSTTQPQTQQRGFEILGVPITTLVAVIGLSAALIAVFVMVRRRKRETE